MKTKSLIVVPIAFAAGMLVIVLLQVAGFIRVGAPAIDQSEIADTVAASDTRSASASADDSNSMTSQSIDAAASATTEDQQTTVILAQQLSELRKQVQAATVDRDVLRRQIEQLDEQVASTTPGNEFLPNGQDAQAVTGEVSADAGEQNQFGWRRGFGGPDGDEQYANLVAAGIDETVAAELKQRTDQWSLQRLELIDQASREGWRRSEQFEDRMSELREARPDVRSELGDADYDNYLYLSGESNRVQIASIIDGSAAQIAGVESGDVMRSYANQRIYSTRELQRATREGSRGETVPMIIERSGQFISMEIPRGPLGVTLSGLRVEPDGS